MPIMAPKVAFRQLLASLSALVYSKFWFLMQNCLFQKGSYSSIGTTIFMQKLRPIL